jgi:hypothetical protein
MRSPAPVHARYLVRTIQKGEDLAWVNGLAKDPRSVLPLPFVPRRTFDHIVVIHRRRVLCFKPNGIPAITRRKIAVGRHGHVVIRSRSVLKVVAKRPRKGASKINGFMGIRYFNRWSQFAK